MKIFTQYKGLKKENYILFLGRIVTNLGAMIWPMMTLILNKKLGLNAAETATFIIVSGIMFLPANLIGGHIADKYNKKRVIIYCDIVSIILFVISGLMPLSFYSLCVLLVGALFQTLEGPAYDALVAAVTPPDKREKAFSLLYLGANIGLIMSPTLAGLLFNDYLWLCFIISGLAISVSTVLIGLFVKNPESTEGVIHSDAEAEEGGSSKKSIFEIIKASRSLILFIIAYSFYKGAYSQFGYLMPLDISKAFPENGSLIYGTVNSVNCIIVVLCTPLLTMILEKMPLPKKYAFGTILQTISFGMFLLSFGVIPGYYASIIMFTFGEILTTIVVGAYLSERVPGNYIGRIYGVTNFTSAFMSGLVQYVSGSIFDEIGTGPAWVFSIVMTMISVIACLILVPEDRKEFRGLYACE
ncbi:MAG: MFS transporter [Butyrivibrio sp.]|jgi:MFS family permease|uniref:MFS transporter n=1 Tax=Butyrivibrio sp. TaxID=28121 RepID=UPI001EC1426D|nr:MFS transporter [Butyrivibrio sp.]MBE5841634.1 MFS transporter [Butyrivibrio sp.]